MFMERTALFTLRPPGKSAILDEYCHYKVDDFWDICSTVDMNEDAWLSYFNIRAGFGTMMVSSVSCFTTIPNIWAEVVGQRRRWFGGLFMSLYMFFGFSSVHNFIWGRWCRIIMWLFFCIPTLIGFYGGVGLVVNDLALLWARAREPFFRVKTNFVCVYQAKKREDQAAHPHLNSHMHVL